MSLLTFITCPTTGNLYLKSVETLFQFGLRNYTCQSLVYVTV